MTTHVPPSPLRIPLTVLLAITLPPLSLVAWIALSGSQRDAYLRSNWVRAGFAVVVLAALPLVAAGGASALGLTSDPNPNPIGLGLLMLVGAILGTILVAVGVVLVSRRGE